MSALLSWWAGRCAGSKSLRFVDLNLRGIGQVMFQDNPLSGLLFFIGIAWGSYAAGMPQVAIGGMVAIVAAKARTRPTHDHAGLAMELSW